MEGAVDGDGVDAMLTVRLLGTPGLERDGMPQPAPRGRKGWALLAYLLLADRPLGRRHLAEVLFADADDPLGALRWTLAELRRALGDSELLRGDPVSSALGADVRVDLTALENNAGDAEALLELRGELLDGVDIVSSQTFESWLVVQRQRISAAIEARLRQTAVALLATGRTRDAVPYARLAVERNRFEESNHELLVRSLAAAGEVDEARRQVAVCEDLFSRELGVAVSDALRDAAATGPTFSMVPPISGTAAVTSQLEAGHAAIGAGAVDAGIQCLRRAVAEAARIGDAGLQGRALVALGGALVHAVRGRDQEGSVLLTEAIEAAARAGDRATAATAHRELGWVDVQAGRRATAEDWLVKAQALAESDDELAAVLAARGMNASDRADYATAFEHLAASVEHAERSGERRQEALTQSLIARAHLLRGEQHQAAVPLERSLDLVREERWLAFLPWPQALRAEIDLALGDLDTAANELENAWALACQIGDPCWEGMAARGLGLLSMGRGDDEGSTKWFAEAVARSNRVTDRYQWVHAYALDATITAALDRDDEATAAPLIPTLATLAARSDMRELVVRAHLHKARLGDSDARSSARLLAADIDNPALAELIDA
ncbi:MAG TPA: BTAD domain-containing putative transcriptional regulator [Jatrophihabitantaceae bacterium]|nr:BTAD domain-containing putative transcriptional regulator [Jatrophihabitantaceae bacterium]